MIRPPAWGAPLEADVTPYEHLAHHYDSLFRLNPQVVAFLERQLGGFEGRRLVDSGCGTGTLARALAD